MIRRIMDFVLLLFFVWACMFLGLWIIDTLIVPMRIPGTGDRFLTGVAQVVISAILVLIWLQIWRWLARTIFWRLLETTTI